MLHCAVRDRVEDLRRQFAGARPFRHVVIDQFLESRILLGPAWVLRRVLKRP